MLKRLCYNVSSLTVIDENIPFQGTIIHYLLDSLMYGGVRGWLVFYSILFDLVVHQRGVIN